MEKLLMQIGFKLIGKRTSPDKGFAFMPAWQPATNSLQANASANLLHIS
jgi:hypothetical protein